MICIYCKSPNADSKSHIIPEALGKGPILKPGVCTKCNNDINNDLEKNINRKLAFIRNFLQLTGKRGKKPSIDIEVTFYNKTYKIPCQDLRDLESKMLVLSITDKSGKKERIAFICPDSTKIEQIKKQYSKKHLDANWEELSTDTIEQNIQYKVLFDVEVFADPKCLRMAAKIALEWWCKKRSPTDIIHTDYDEIRQYIRYGTGINYPIVSIVNDRNTISPVANVPFGIHTLFIGSDHRNNNLVVLLGLFSFVFYKVILNRRYLSLTKLEELATINPQTGFCYEPSIRVSLGFGPNISDIQETDYWKPLDVLRGMEQVLLNRLNEGLENILMGSRTTNKDLGG
jgi:hypothetical protein